MLGFYIPFSVVHPSPGHVQVLDSPGFEEDKNLIRQVFRTHEVWDAAGMDCGFMLGLLLGSRSDMLDMLDVNRYDTYIYIIYIYIHHIYIYMLDERSDSV